MKSLNIIYYIFIASIVVIAGLLVISIFPITGNIKFMVVQSGSMEPAIKRGNIVMVKPVGEYKIGDIVTFDLSTSDIGPITHRIHDIKVVEDEVSYITKGDANNAPDMREISRGEIVGKVLFTVPYVGYAVDFAKRPLGFALIILIPATVIISDEVKKIYGEIKKKKTNENEQEND